MFYLSTETLPLICIKRRFPLTNCVGHDRIGPWQERGASSPDGPLAQPPAWSPGARMSGTRSGISATSSLACRS